MIALLFALLVTDPPVAPPASPPVVSGGGPVARADDPPPIPTPFPCLVGTPAGGTSLPPNAPVLTGGGTMSTSTGNEAGVASGSVCPRPASLAVVPTGSIEAEGATTLPVRSGGGAASASYAAGLVVAPVDPTPGASDPPVPTEHVVSPCPPPSSGSSIPASTGNEPGTSSGSSHCPRPGLAFGPPLAGVRTAAPPAPGSDSAGQGAGPRRFLGLTRRQWGWVGAIAGAVVIGVIVGDDDGGSMPVGPDGR